MINKSYHKLFLLVLAFTFLVSAESVELGGPRKISAEITKQGKDWLVLLRMRPVQCFDQAMNRKVQQKLGYDYALVALAKMLKTGTLSATSCHCQGMSQEKNVVTLQILIKGVRKNVVTAKKDTDSSQITVNTSSESLLTSADDWSRTISSFKRTIQEDLKLVFVHVPFDDENVIQLTQMEEDFRQGYNVLKAKIKEDIQLLQLERSPLLDQCESDEKAMTSEMKKIGKLLENAERFHDVQIEAAYAMALLDSPILMMNGDDVKVMTDADGRRMIISVGKAEIRNTSAKDRIRQIKAAQMRAIRQLLLWTESHITTKSTMTEQTIVTKTGNETHVDEIETYQEITKEEADGVVKGLPTIGTWTSKDNQIFYLAIGSFL